MMACTELVAASSAAATLWEKPLVEPAGARGASLGALRPGTHRGWLRVRRRSAEMDAPGSPFGAPRAWASAWGPSRSSRGAKRAIERLSCRYTQLHSLNLWDNFIKVGHEELFSCHFLHIKAFRRLLGAASRGSLAFEMSLPCCGLGYALGQKASKGRIAPAALQCHAQASHWNPSLLDRMWRRSRGSPC